MLPSRFRSAALVLVVLLSGCYSHRVTTVGTNPQGTPPAVTDYEYTTTWNVLWGLYGNAEVVPDNCQGQPFAEVEASSNLAFDVLRVVTLGAVAPVRLGWKCAGATPEPEPFPVPDE